MNSDKIGFAIKNTNWCNLNCVHCCECSGPNVVPNIMPLNKVEKYITDFNAVKYPKWEYVVFTGGEAMAPYFHNQNTYIPSCLDIATSCNMVPVVKTNATWGTDDRMRKRILNDFAGMAYKHQKLMSLEMSIDEFHDNMNGIVNIISDVVRSTYLAPAVRLALVGLNTVESYIRFLQLVDKMNGQGLFTVINNGELDITIPNLHQVKVFFDLWAMIANVGRAKKNNLGVYKPTGKPEMFTGHCLQIDNHDVAILNNVHREKIQNENLSQIITKLIARTK